MGGCVGKVRSCCVGVCSIRISGVAALDHLLLDLPADLLHLVLLPPAEKHVSVQNFCFGRAYFMEAVHIELPHERLEVGVFEIGWQDRLAESLNVVDDEAIAFVVPADDRAEFLGLK